jgi:hypothetical protein
MKKFLLGSLLVFIAWSILDFIVHGKLLMPQYAATASLWRPMDQMNMGAMALVRALVALAFSAIYLYQIKGTSIAAGAKFGLVFGLAMGIHMGFGSYGYMPIPMSLAWGWMLGCVANSVVGGALLGWVAKA